MPEARMPLWRLRLILAVLFVSIMSLEVTVVTSQDNLVLIPGDVNLVAIFRTNEVQAGQCGEYSVDSLQELMAVTWFLDSVNAMNYVNNVTIGLEAVRTCKMPEKANQAIIELMNKYEVGMPGSDNTTLLFGFIGPDRTSEATAVSKLIGALPANQRVLQISGSATGRQLSDRTLHPNFFRVIPSDALQIQVILDVLLQLDWNYIAIIYSEGDYGRGGAFELRRLAEQNQICVPVFESLPEDVASTAFLDQLGNIATQVMWAGRRRATSYPWSHLSVLFSLLRVPRALWHELRREADERAIRPTVDDDVGSWADRSVPRGVLRIPASRVVAAPSPPSARGRRMSVRRRPRRRPSEEESFPTFGRGPGVDTPPPPPRPRPPRYSASRPFRCG